MDADEAERAVLTVAALARRLGVAPATLRTWDRRYGVGPSEHAAGAHRRYTPSDVACIERMRQLTLEGVTPAEAARVALSASWSGEKRGSPERDGSDLPAVVRSPGPSGGGRIIAVPGGAAEVKGLARAVTALDANAASTVISAQIARDGVVSTWDNLLLPLLVSVGERWHTLAAGVAIEHLFSEVILGCLRGSVRVAPPANSRPILLACAPEEQHTLPVHVLGAALNERGVSSRVLGGRVPVDALYEAVKRCGPAAVFIWAHRPEVKPPGLLDEIPVMRPPVAVVVGGQGWNPKIPPSVARAESLSQAVAVLTRSALGSASVNR